MKQVMTSFVCESERVILAFLDDIRILAGRCVS